MSTQYSYDEGVMCNSLIRATYSCVPKEESDGNSRERCIHLPSTMIDSYGYLLEKALGPKFEVLNFGACRHGGHEVYFRYAKDAREWKAMQGSTKLAERL